MTCTEERFLTNAACHEMKVLRDDGVYRHLRFLAPERSAYWFELLTWPGCLCIHGDMGTFVFSRTPDMFEFFRHERTNGPGNPLYINTDYWAEKLRASDCRGRRGEGSVKVWSPEQFEQRIKQRFVEHVRSEMSGMPAERKELRQRLKWDVLEESAEEQSAIRAALDFNMHGLCFEDFWEADCTEWDFHFVWCLYAIAWGIRQYDQAERRAQVAA